MDFKPLYEFAYANLGDAAHGRDHILRVRNNALEIARDYPVADAVMLEAAAILHDCGQPEQNRDPRCDHALEGARKAEELLKLLGFGAGFAEDVARLIAAHSSPEKARGEGIEAMILFDADKLEMTGAVGIVRAAAYCAGKRLGLYGEACESLYTVAQGDMEFASERLFTPEARGLAKERLMFMKLFLEQLKQETDV